MASSSFAAVQFRHYEPEFSEGSSLPAPTVEDKRVAQQFCSAKHNGTEEMLAMSDSRCMQCTGRGVIGMRGRGRRTCQCVWRKVFRSCLDHYQNCHEMDGLRMSVIAVMDSPLAPGPSRRIAYGFKHSEYIADFELIARRTLEKQEMQILKMYFLEGRIWRECCTRLRMEKGDFFHLAYRVEEKLGRCFYDTRPYPLYPAREYFNDARI